MNSLCLDDKRPSISLEDLSAESLLPSDEDLQQIRANFGILIGRVLTEYLPSLHRLSDVVEMHIKHEYYAEMSQRSEVVSSCNLVQ